MDVITAPTPDPETEPPHAMLPSPTDRPALLPWWAWTTTAVALIVGLAIGGLLSPWRSAPQPAAPSLAETLEWMFTASLTYAATTEDGVEIPPPANAVAVREVEVLDPVRGPILAIVELDHQTTSEVVAYEITTRRTGRAWTVDATPLGDQRPGE